MGGAAAGRRSGSRRARPHPSGSWTRCAAGSARAGSPTSASSALPSKMSSSGSPWSSAVRRAAPHRLRRLPEQYFSALLARVAAAAARDGEPLVDLGRGNPDIPPPPHVVEALSASAGRADTHGYAPFAGLPTLKEAIAVRYRDAYGVDVDPATEVAVLPGSKTGLMEFAQVCVDRGETIVLPDPGYPDYRSAVALSGARHVPLPLDVDARPEWDAAPAEASALYLNYPSNP